MGIKAFFCIVHNTSNYHMNPVWFFTSEALMNYMLTTVPLHKPWDLAYIGAKLEAFVIAGCDVVSKSIVIHLGTDQETLTLLWLSLAVFGSL